MEERGASASMMHI